MTTRFRHPYAEFLQDVEKPTRYIGGEYQQVTPEERAKAGPVRARVCLAFPDTYEIGMSHLGTKILYSVLNKTAGISCERAFAPWVDMEAELRKRELPVLTLESASPLADFDVVGFSLQYELTYSNVLLLLDLSRIPLRSAERGDQSPLIIAGGPTATHPEPLAPFIDAFFIGEAEEDLPGLCLEAAELRRAGVPRRERLCQLASRYPLYVPELYSVRRDPETGFTVVDEPLDPRVPRRPRRVWVKDINRFPFPDDSPLPYSEAIFDRMAVEVARGCTEGCRFCQAGMIYRPVRERDPVAVMDALVGGIKKGGYDETSLTSLSTADYSCVTPLVKAAMARLREERVSLSVSSLRAYGLNDDLLADMATMKAQGLTFAPEAGTQRMRDVITKNVTEEDITKSAERVFGRGFQRMKLYFMIGLPTETDEDVRGIVETAARVKEIGKSQYKGAEVTASVSTHVPKPHTPFQWAAMDTEEETTRKQAILADAARELRVKLKVHENFQSHIEGIFSRGDRACASLLERAYRLGCRFDGWEECLRPELWEQAIAEETAQNGFDPGRYLGTIPITATLPWDHLDMGLEPDFLLKEYRKALKDRLSPPCGKPYKQLLHASSVEQALAEQKKKLVCYDCGVACDLSAMKEERLYFLRRMNAWTPPVAPPPRPRAAPQAGPRDGGPQVRRPVTSMWQSAGEGRRYRLRYTKLGRTVYLGHLDLIRHLPRIFRRAGLELRYSEGFHPKPELSFGPALGLGIPSLGEILDVKMSEEVDGPALVELLNQFTLSGISFLDAVRLEDGDGRSPRDASLGRVLTFAQYVAILPDSTDVTRAVRHFASGEPLVVLRAGSSEHGRPKLGRTVDVRRTLRDVAPAGAELRARVVELAAADRALDGGSGAAMVVFSSVISTEGGARPSEVIAALTDEATADGTQFVRIALHGGAPDGDRLDPLDLPRLREHAAVLAEQRRLARASATALTPAAAARV